ncbi:MAG: hypothetical protein IKQ69_06470 [Oscillospiraceae bacterium]|nr:hypothetical protein [Oscillospiraceae bacterium]
MKKALPYIVVAIISVVITFFFFEAMSWYHFGDIPTPVVLIRMIIFCVASICLISSVIYLRKRKKQ